MPALAAEAHNSDGVFAHLRFTGDTVVTFPHNIAEFSATAARNRDTCVLATVLAPLVSFFPPHIPARKHDVEGNIFEPVFQHYLEIRTRRML